MTSPQIREGEGRQRGRALLQNRAGLSRVQLCLTRGDCRASPQLRQSSKSLGHCSSLQPPWQGPRLSLSPGLSLPVTLYFANSFSDSNSRI